MKYFVFNTKGGCGKSTIAREIIAAPMGKKIAMVEVDPLNSTQEPFKDLFKCYIQIHKKELCKLGEIIVEHDDVVIDVGADNLTKTLDIMIDYKLFKDIDKVIIPMSRGRTECENAIKTYSLLKTLCSNIIFAFNEFDPDPYESMENLYYAFFKNFDMSEFKDKVLPEHMYITIDKSDLFIDAHNQKKTVIELAADIDYKSAAIAAKNNGDMDKFRSLMKQEFDKRSTQILVENCIMPAHEKIIQ